VPPATHGLATAILAAEVMVCSLPHRVNNFPDSITENGWQPVPMSALLWEVEPVSTSGPKDQSVFSFPTLQRSPCQGPSDVAAHRLFAFQSLGAQTPLQDVVFDAQLAVDGIP
jgi:hypothetical protein